MKSNFEFLSKYWPNLAQMGKMAELYLHVDANQCISQLCTLAETVAVEICNYEKLALPEQSTHTDRIRAIKYADLLPKRIDDIFYVLRRAKDKSDTVGIYQVNRAVDFLQLCFTLCCWLMKVFGDNASTLPCFFVPEDKSYEEGFEATFRDQEKKVKALATVNKQIKTANSDTTRGQRVQNATEVANALPLAQLETCGFGNDPIRIDVEVLSLINYAIQHNGVGAIHSITIENRTDNAIANVDLTINATPRFAVPFVRHIDHLPANQTVTISNPNLILDGQYLASITERVSGFLQVEIKSGETVLACDNFETTVLSFDEWHGLSLYPELLASFVTPNHPEVARIIARATEHLGKWTGDTAMDAYQSRDPNRVISQAGAIFTAIKEQAIAYSVPPASFGYVGQRVRLCDTVLRQKLGTCLDLTLLYASCLEAVGLHPLLIVTTGHIFTGVWLEEKMFPESVQDDFSLITKRLASGVNEIAVVETTCVTTSRDSSFDDARTSGEKNLYSNNTECIIDVLRARKSGILPLPQRIFTLNGWEIRHDATFSKESMSAPTELGKTIYVDPNLQDENIPKKVQWERKLLDLGLRNTLINLRMTKTQIPILTNSLDALENALSSGSDFTILPKPIELELESIDFETLNNQPKSALIDAEFANKRLRSVFTDTELGNITKGLYRTAKTALEENGANTLYLALGLLRWFETPRSTKPRYAPIILLPIEMVRKSALQGYVIRLRDEDPQMNVTLLEKLKQDFGVVVKGLDPLPADERGVDIRDIDIQAQGGHLFPL